MSQTHPKPTLPTLHNLLQFPQALLAHLFAITFSLSIHVHIGGRGGGGGGDAVEGDFGTLTGGGPGGAGGVDGGGPGGDVYSKQHEHHHNRREL